MTVRKDVDCSQCGAKINRVFWNYGKNRPITEFFCDNNCKGLWQKLQREKLGFTKEWLFSEYVTNRKSANQIAREIKRDPKRVWEWIRDYGLETRPRGTDYGQNIKLGQKSYFKGKKHSEETKKRLSEIAIKDGRMPFKKENGAPNKGKFGSESFNWKGGLTPERQAFYSSEEWCFAVKEVWKRDKGVCQKCGVIHNNGLRGTFHIHHIVSFQVREKRSEVSNLVLLCKTCHRWVHSKKNVEKQFIKE